MSRSGVVVREVDQPSITDEGVLIRVVAGGICGTDLAIVSRKLKAPLPLVLGHEFAGEVAAVGKDVEDIDVGNRATSEINLTCGKCFFCESGIPTHCLKRKAIGIDVNGAFAELMAVPRENVHILPEPISYEEGVFIEPLAAAIQTMKLSKIDSKDTVVIVGDGRLGQLVAQAVKAAVPDSKVLMLGKHDSKLRLAEEIGAVDRTINVARQNPEKTVMSETEGLGANVAVEATGKPDAVNMALGLVRHRGTVALKSTHGENATIDATQVAVREITLQGSRCGPFDEAINMLSEGKVKVKPLISARFPLAEALEAFKVAGKPETLKVILFPSIP
nr:alcohol dehydrogenase catalytic domain-containing protein [Candidatus Njordarchaeum guaymaensis]